MRDGFLRRSFNRRSMLKATGGAALGTALARESLLRIDAAAQASTPTANIAGTELKILQWSHFVPSYDEWFDAFAKAWGQANQVNVTVEHINTADVPAAIASDISAGSGHDLV